MHTHEAPSGARGRATGPPPSSAGGAAAVERFASQQWTAGVIGLGYVGLPLAMTAVTAGLRCIGFDLSGSVVERLARGCSHVDDVSDEALRTASAAGFEVTTSPARLREADALIVCVPSPLGRNRQPDMSHIKAAAATVADVVTPGTLVVLESTACPGTTDEVMVPAATSTGLELDRDVFVAFSPERVDPGNAWSTRDIPRVVGGVSAMSGMVAAAAYRRLVSAVCVVSSARVAELAKLLENTYRAVNIGLINELAQLAHQLGIDVWEVIDAAATKPFGFQAFHPGPGVGGHCIPLDPQFLAWRAREVRFATRFIDLAEQVNTTMPAYAVARIAELLNSVGKPVHASRVLAVGVAYKPNVSDDRESPAWDVIAGLEARGAHIAVHDPVVGCERLARRGHEVVDRPSDMGDHDIAVILTDHDRVDLHAIAARVPLVFDTRGAYHRRGLAADHIVAL